MNLSKEKNNANRDYVYQQLDVSNDKINIAHMTKGRDKNGKITNIMDEDVNSVEKAIMLGLPIIEHPQIHHPSLYFGTKFSYETHIPYEYKIMSITSDTTANFNDTINFQIVKNTINMASLKLHLTLNIFGTGVGTERLTTQGILGLIDNIELLIDNTHSIYTIYNSALAHIDYWLADSEEKAILLANAAVNESTANLHAQSLVITEYSLPFYALTKVFEGIKRTKDPVLRLKGKSQLTVRIKFNTLADGFFGYTATPAMSNVKLTYEYLEQSANNHRIHEAVMNNHVQKYIYPVRQVEKFLMASGSTTYEYQLNGMKGNVFAIAITLHPKANYDAKQKLTLIADEISDCKLDEDSQEIFSYKSSNAQNMMNIYSRKMLGYALPANCFIIPIGGNHHTFRENFEHIHSTQYFMPTANYKIELKFKANLAADTYMNITYFTHCFIHSAVNTYQIINN